MHFLNDVIALVFFFHIHTVYFGVVTSHKILFSCLYRSSLSCVQRFFSKMKLKKTLLPTQLKQGNLENGLHNSTESPKEHFNTVFHVLQIN